MNSATKKFEAGARKNQFAHDMAIMAGETPPPMPDPVSPMDQFKSDLAALKIGDKSKPARSDALPADRLAQSEHARNMLTATFPTSWSFEQVLLPDTWRLCVQRGAFDVGTLIEVRRDDLAFWGLLLVTVCDRFRGLAEVEELIRKDLQPAKAAGDDSGAFTTEYKGITDKWVITRAADGKVMQAGLPSRSEANREIQLMTPRSLSGGPA